MVRMSEQLTFGSSIADWQERIDVARLRSDRAERARRILRERGIPAILVTRVVTPDGAELIDRWPRDEILVAPRA